MTDKATLILAAEICRNDESGRDSGGYFADAILSAIPADSKAALRELCTEVAFRSVKFGAMHAAGINMNGLDSTELEAIVNSVLEGKS